MITTTEYSTLYLYLKLVHSQRKGKMCKGWHFVSDKKLEVTVESQAKYLTDIIVLQAKSGCQVFHCLQILGK